VVPAVKPLSAYEVAPELGEAISTELRYRLYPVIAEPPSEVGTVQVIVIPVADADDVDGADICEGVVRG
jgi:hypothetical protein